MSDEEGDGVCRRIRTRLADADRSARDDPHLTACPTCREFARAAQVVDEALATLTEEQPGGQPFSPFSPLSPLFGRIAAAAGRGGGRSQIRSTLRWVTAAAAVAGVILTAGIYVKDRGAGTEQESVSPLVADPSSLVSRPSPTASFRQLEDGSRLWLSPNGSLRMEEPVSGERWTARLDRGTLWAEVAKGGGTARVVSEAGEIRVLGTRFVARAFRIHASRFAPRLPSEAARLSAPKSSAQAGASLSVLSVEVSSGLVELHSPLSHPSPPLQVRSGQRGLLLGDGRNRLQEAVPLSWREALRRFGKELPEGAEGESPFAAATLLAGSWGGLAEAGWESILFDPLAEARERTVAATLVARSAERGEGADAARLQTLIERETDEAVREILQTHLARLKTE